MLIDNSKARSKKHSKAIISWIVWRISCKVLRLMYCTLTHHFPTPPSSAPSSCAPIQHKVYIPARTFLGCLPPDLSDVLSCFPSPPPRCGGLWQRLLDSFVSITLIRRPDSLQSPLSQAPPKRELACCLMGEGYFLFILDGVWWSSSADLLSTGLSVAL